MFVIKTPILKLNSIKLLRFLYKIKTLTCMHIEARKNISIKISSMKKKRKAKKKRGKAEEKIIIKVMVFGTNDLEMIAK